MNLKKSILGLFVDIEEEKESKQHETTPATPVQTVVFESKYEGKTDTAIAESLAGALEVANIEGFDYFEFAKTIDALAITIPAEQVRYQTAFTSASVMGVTKQKLLETAQHYITTLNEEAQKFSKFVDEQLLTNITSKETSLTKIDESVQEKANIIQQLTQEINELTQQKNTIANEISENKIKIERVQNDFTATLKVFLDKIQKDIEKITAYIP